MALFAASAHAAPVRQGEGASYIALEAENITSETVRDANEPIFTLFEDADDGASGDVALIAADPDVGEVYTGAEPNIVTYQLLFNEAGTYHFYLRGRGVDPVDEDTTETGPGSDSVFVADLWNDDTPQLVADLPDGGADVGYEYRNFATLTVDPADVGQLLSYSIGTREDGAIIDRLVFSTQSDLTGEQLAGLANSPLVPEPGTLSLLGLAGLGLLRRRRA